MDVSWFIDSMNREVGEGHKWVIIGGSYPGAMSAWFKHVYPDKVSAAWSSSGVINAIVDFNMFDQDILETTQNSSLQCSQNVRYA
jgi:hypothetical protein